MMISLLLATLLSLSTAAAADQALAPGALLPPLVLSDQHDVEGHVDAETRLVLYARDMAAGDLVEAALDADGAKKLSDAGAVYIAEISGMPSLISRLFAIPALRKRPYRMLLDRHGDATAHLPAENGKVTILRLDKLKIVALEFAATTDAVAAALKPPGEPLASARR